MLKKIGINFAPTLQFLKYVLRFYDPNTIKTELDKKIDTLRMIEWAESGKAETFLTLILEMKVDGLGSMRSIWVEIDQNYHF